MQEGEQEQRGEQAEVRGGAKWRCPQTMAAMEAIEQEEEEDGERHGREDRPRREMRRRELGEYREDQAEDDRSKRQAAERAQGEAGRRVSVGSGAGMLPGIDEEAVQAAEKREEQRCGEQDGAQSGFAGDGGDEGGGGEEDADGELLGNAMGNLRCHGVGSS